MLPAPDHNIPSSRYLIFVRPFRLSSQAALGLCGLVAKSVRARSSTQRVKRAYRSNLSRPVTRRTTVCVERSSKHVPEIVRVGLITYGPSIQWIQLQRTKVVDLTDGNGIWPTNSEETCGRYRRWVWRLGLCKKIAQVTFLFGDAD